MRPEWVINVHLLPRMFHCNVPNKGIRACHWLLPLINCIFEAERSVTLRRGVLKISSQLIDMSPFMPASSLPACDRARLYYRYLYSILMSSLKDAFVITGPNNIEQSSKVTLRSRDIDNPVIAKVIKKPSIFYEKRIFFTAFSGSPHYCVYRAIRFRSTYCLPLNIGAI